VLSTRECDRVPANPPTLRLPLKALQEFEVPLTDVQSIEL